jgi:hypothetical protein
MSIPIWTPSIREIFSHDFEERVNQETAEDENAWLWMVPEPLENGEDMSFAWFHLMANKSETEGNLCFQDFWLRKAAQRGSMLAMQELAGLRYHLGHLEESLRWNYRRLYALLGDAAVITEADYWEGWQEDVETTVNNIAFLSGEGIAIGEGVWRNNPRDLGDRRDYRDFLYCLKCGSLKYAFAPIAQCDDSVHASFANFGS